jgi:hypothetical protein
MAVLGQEMPKVGKAAFLAVALAEEPRITVGGRGVSVVPALLAAEVRVAVPPTARATVTAFAPWPEALHRSPGLDQRAVDGEVLVREQPAHLGPVQHLGHEPRRHVALEQAVPVLRERRVVPYRIVDAETDEPAE